MQEFELGNRWPVSPLPLDWHRGPAWVDGDDIVMDLANITRYQPRTQPQLGVELSRIRTADDAAEFVRQYGLLTKEADRHLPVEVERPAGTLREPFALFQRVAEDLRTVLETMLAVRLARSGDEDALHKLREWYWDLTEPVGSDGLSFEERYTDRRLEVVAPAPRLKPADEDRSIMALASQVAAGTLNAGMIQGKPQVAVFDRAFAGEAVPPGSWRIGLEQSTLEVLCYMSVALTLTDQQPIGICAEPSCRRIFFITDGRQRYCTATCANRARFKRFKERHGGKAAASKEG